MASSRDPLGIFIGARVVVLILAAAYPVAARAAVKPHSLISDGAVLQQGMELPIWGTAKDGEKVTVTFLDQEVATTTAEDGRWLVRLKPLKPGGPFTMTISGENTVVLKDLLVGEVWVCSGQSNMAMQLYTVTNGKAAAATARDPLLRLCTVRPPAAAATPLADVGLRWTGAENAGAFSAVGYFFGRDLRKALNVPVGLIHASVGATAIGWWMNREAFDLVPTTRRQIESELKGNTCKLYNGMIAPLQPYSIRGVIWYQGESDSRTPARYLTMFPAMIRGWRKAWGGSDFTFLFVQVAPCERWPPEIRESQLLAWQQTPKTGMVVTTDCGNAKEIHPPLKEPVGVRLALAARAVAYGEKIESSGPVYSALQIEGNRAIISFTHIGAGLEARGPGLQGFTIAGQDGKFVAGVARIDGNKIIVSSAKVPKPVAVRYGWANVPDVNLYNKDGLPATPFRTDTPVGPVVDR